MIQSDPFQLGGGERPRFLLCSRGDMGQLVEASASDPGEAFDRFRSMVAGYSEDYEVGPDEERFAEGQATIPAFASWGEGALQVWILDLEQASAQRSTEIARFADQQRPGVAWVIEPDPILATGFLIRRIEGSESAIVIGEIEARSEAISLAADAAAGARI